MKLSDLTVEVRNKNLDRLGIIRPEDLDMKAQEVFNNVGSWTIKLPSEHPMVPHLRTPGSGIIVTGPLDVLFSGPTTKPESVASPEDPYGSVTFDGVTDDIILRDYVSYPQPSNADATTQNSAHDTRTGTVESLMYAYVNANLGPSAPAARKKANLTLGANGNRGATITKKPRFQVIGNLLTDIAALADLGFRVVQRGSVLVFETYAIVDRTALIRLDIRNGQLSGQRTAISPPTATRIIVAGQNEGVDRQFVERNNAASVAAETEWGRRIERFLDQRNTDVVAELEQAGDEVLAEEGFTAVSAQVVPTDDTNMIFGRDWFLGDQVTVVVESQELSATVTGMAISVNGDGLKVGAVIGDPTKFDREATYVQRVQNVSDRVSQIERNVEVGIERVSYLTDNAFGEAIAYTSYPQGHSYMAVTAWTLGAGLVITDRPPTGMAVQEFISSATQDKWMRRYVSGAWTGWGKHILNGGSPTFVNVDATGTISIDGNELPYAMATGTKDITVAAASSTGSDTISFTAGRFSVAPFVFVQLNDTGYIASTSGISTTGATITLRHVDANTAGATRTVHWMAVQMQTGSASY